MKKIFLLLAFFALSNAGYSQIYDPVKWSTSVEKISDTEYNLLVTATIEAKWHLYSQNVPADGPIPTSFSFKTSQDFKLIGKTTEEKGHTVHDPVFDMEIKYFENKATFKQRVKVSNQNAFKILGEVEFMVCDDSSCLPPTVIVLAFLIPGNKANATIVPTDDSKEVVEVAVDKNIEIPVTTVDKNKENVAVVAATNSNKTTN
ncbi:MAG: protein-disulfide reductase DsbD family protein, partial [Lutibacter sp.]|nr:protein-disulfide reductase DsbD family protein [Lutibacter sp.]